LAFGARAKTFKSREGGGGGGKVVFASERFVDEIDFSRWNRRRRRRRRRFK